MNKSKQPPKTAIKEPITASTISKTATKEKQKTTSNNNINNVLVKNSIPGYGLWCTNTDYKSITKDVVSVEELENKLAKLEYANKQNINADVESGFDKKIIEKLKQQLYDANSRYDRMLVLFSESEYKAERAEANRKTYFEVQHINNKIIVSRK